MMTDYLVTLMLALLGWMLVAVAVRQMNKVTRNTRRRWAKTALWAPVACLGLWLGMRPAVADSPAPKHAERPADAP